MSECCKKSYIIWILSPFYIVAIVLNFLCLFRLPYNRGLYDDLKQSWEKSPIISISFDQYYINKLKGKINVNNTNELHKALVVKRLDKKYNYKYLLREDVNEPGFHLCGKDGEGNYLFLHNDTDCPINEFRISFSSNPHNDEDEYNYYYRYKTTKFYDGIYLHYSNENIYSTILTDIDFKLVNSMYNNYEPYSQIYFTSNRIIEDDYTLYLIMKNYMGLSLSPPIDGKRDLTEFKTFLNYGTKLGLNIISLIFLILSFVTLIIDSTKEAKPPIFQIITFILLYIQIVIQIIIFIYYGELDQIDIIMNKYYDIFYFDSEYFIYNTVILSFVVIIATFYLFLTNYRKNDNNYYYFLVYCFRYSIFNKCCFCCKERVERNKERNIRIIYELNIEINKLEEEKYERNVDKNELIDNNRKILEEIENKSNILKKMKEDENSDRNMNEEEEIKFEKLFQKLIKENKLNIKKFEDLRKQIKETEKEINYYKMIEFKKELNNQ